MSNPRFPRRTLLSAAALGAAATAWPEVTNGDQGTGRAREVPSQEAARPTSGSFPIRVISSLNGLEATKTAFELIKKGHDTLEAVVKGVGLVEADPKDTSVGYGGLPNEDGVVELDAAVMHGPRHRAGSVASLRNIIHPAQVALKVMQLTDHELLVGEGALRFARAVGFKETNLLTDRARRLWLRWKQNLSNKDDWLNREDETADDDTTAFFRRHSTIERVAGQVRYRFRRPTGTIHCAGMNQRGEISCTTTTSGLAFKIPGRVGDSPIIGAGLYVDNEIGSCGSTGRGEANLQNLCSFAAVELMRGGMSPRDAGLEICRRVASHCHRRDLQDEQGRPKFGLKFYLLNKQGDYAGVTLWGPAKFSVTDDQGTRREPCAALYSSPE